jgi:hypothetical protein
VRAEVVALQQPERGREADERDADADPEARL